jgi:putative spermidine/putrescine transport system permease protein
VTSSGAPGAVRPLGRSVVLALLITGALLPLVPLVGWAFAGQWRYPALRPQQLSLRGIRLLTDSRSQIPQALLTSTLIAAAVAVLATVIGYPAGRAVGLYRFRGRRAVQFLLLAPVLVPGLASAVGLQVFFIRYGLADSATGVVLVQLIPTVPYAATVMAAAFANLDTDYERQARALGAGPMRVLLFVTLPLMRPALLLAGLFAFLISWSEYVLTLLIGGGQVSTLPLLLFAAISSSDTTVAAALALLVVGPPLVLVVASARLLSARSGAVIGLGRL